MEGLRNICDEIYMEIGAGKTLCKLIDTDEISEHFNGLPGLFGNVFDKIQRHCEALDEFVSSQESAR